MTHLVLEDIVKLHEKIIAATGGSSGMRDRGGLESALAQPRMSFGGEDLYPSLEEKAAALGFSLIMNHPFVDGNKRIGHAAMELFLRANGRRIVAKLDDAEQMILSVAASQASREELTTWIKSHVVEAKQ